MTLAMSKRTIQARIAIGEKHREKKYPVKLDHFIATMPFDKAMGFAPRHVKLSEYLKAKYGTDKPKFIEVVLIDDHPDEVFYTNYMNYRGSTCCCKGDDKVALRVMADGTRQEVKCDYETCDFRMTTTSRGVINTCKPNGILTFIIPGAPTSGGVIKFTTHSVMTIKSLNGFLREVYGIRKTLKYLEVTLKLVCVTVKVDGKDTNVYVVEAELPFSWDEVRGGAGTSMETLSELKKRYLSMGERPNPETMKELETIAETECYDGSMDGVKVIEGETIATTITDDEDVNF